MLVKLMVEGRADRQFFQVIIVEAESIAAAKQSALAYLATDGKKLIAFDEQETAIVTPDQIHLRRLTPPVEGVVAASGCIWVDAN